MLISETGRQRRTEEQKRRAKELARETELYVPQKQERAIILENLTILPALLLPIVIANRSKQPRTGAKVSRSSAPL
jgi:hypothetical protein